jgi:hypothetical protein
METVEATPGTVVVVTELLVDIIDEALAELAEVMPWETRGAVTVRTSVENLVWVVVAFL